MLQLLAICTLTHCPMSFEVFGRISADNIALYITDLIVPLLSAVAITVNTRNPVRVVAIHADAMPSVFFGS